VSLLLLAVAVLAAWAAVLRLDMMSGRPAIFFAGWLAMMAAMMLPSVAPLVLLYRQRGRIRLVLGYLFVWAAAGIPVYALSQTVGLMAMPTAAAAAVLAAAGVYQFMPLKDACLRTCRSPLDFLALRWGRDPVRIGVDHGLWCLGCCWGLMVVVVIAAAMNLAVAALIAAVICAEKVLPRGERTARATGAALLAAALLVIV
jgi:predicted metal-binding membrane protein